MQLLARNALILNAKRATQYFGKQVKQYVEHKNMTCELPLISGEGDQELLSRKSAAYQSISSARRRGSIPDSRLPFLSPAEEAVQAPAITVRALARHPGRE